MVVPAQVGQPQRDVSLVIAVSESSIVFHINKRQPEALHAPGEVELTLSLLDSPFLRATWTAWGKFDCTRRRCLHSLWQFFHPRRDTSEN